MKWKIRINRVEYYEMDVVVEADNEKEAINSVDAEWEDSSYLYEKLTECPVDGNAFFTVCGLANENEIKQLINI
jgi:hypothetical protein